MIPPDEVLSCGCVLRCGFGIDGTRILTLIPCRSTCQNYRNALSLAAEAGRPVEYREAP